MPFRTILFRLPRYLWAAPCSMVGLVVAFFAVLLGAKARVQDGTLQVVGGRLVTGISRLPTRLTILAFTYGHVIFAVSQSILDSYRGHELVHVRQYERWGPLFPVLYIGSSLIQKWKGRDPYFANRFEQEAHKADAAHNDSPGVYMTHE
jgi:hypothetical protein